MAYCNVALKYFLQHSLHYYFKGDNKANINFFFLNFLFLLFCLEDEEGTAVWGGK